MFSVQRICSLLELVYMTEQRIDFLQVLPHRVAPSPASPLSVTLLHHSNPSLIASSDEHLLSVLGVKIGHGDTEILSGRCTTSGKIYDKTLVGFSNFPNIHRHSKLKKPSKYTPREKSRIFSAPAIVTAVTIRHKVHNALPVIGHKPSFPFSFRSSEVIMGLDLDSIHPLPVEV